MRDADTMTIDELQELVRQKQHLNTIPTITKTAELKCDLYISACIYTNQDYYDDYLTKTELEKEAQGFRASFECIKKGTKFEFVQYPDGSGYWSNEEYQCEIYDRDAKKYLIRIKKVKAK